MIRFFSPSEETSAKSLRFHCTRLVAFTVFGKGPDVMTVAVDIRLFYQCFDTY